MHTKKTAWAENTSCRNEVFRGGQKTAAYGVTQVMKALRAELSIYMTISTAFSTIKTY